MTDHPYGILHRETSTAADGTPTTLIVEPHHYAGHGRVDGTARWTVYRESNYRPILASGTYRSSKGEDVAARTALQRGRAALREWSRR